MQELSYHETRMITREAAEAAFVSDDSREIAFALVSVAFYDPDWRWVQEHCLVFVRSETAALRQIAITCLCHLAPIHTKLDLERVLPVLDELSHDPEVQVEDALDDIRMYLKVDGKGE